MPQYSEEFKEQSIPKMVPPNVLSVAQVSRGTGVSDVTLYNWRNRTGPRSAPYTALQAVNLKTFLYLIKRLHRESGNPLLKPTPRI
jgi:transposase-like protein